jgi:hypothetical protein
MKMAYSAAELRGDDFKAMRETMALLEYVDEEGNPIDLTDVDDPDEDDPDE